MNRPLQKTMLQSFIDGIADEELLEICPETPAVVMESIEQSMPDYTLPLQEIRDREVVIQKEIDRLLHELLWAALSSLGCFAPLPATAAQIRTQSGIIDKYDKWFDETLAFFERYGALSLSGDRYSSVNVTRPSSESLWDEWNAAKVRWTAACSMDAQVTLVETMLRALPEILTGKVPAVDIMFPGSSMSLVEGVYKNNAVADFFNECLGEYLVGYLKERIRINPETRLKLIEIGAGTGGTSVVLFRKLQPYAQYIEEYCYSDLSQAFLQHGEREYSKLAPYLTYAFFDAGRSVEEQGFRAGTYDIAIATNVLHATKNIHETLRNSKALLKRHGALLINDLSDKSLFTHLTFGLLEGWWLYEDPELRIAGNPGLYPERWKNVLGEEGFPEVVFPAASAHDLGQQIVIAVSDGVVRQAQSGLAPVHSLPAAKEGKSAGTILKKKRVIKKRGVSSEDAEQAALSYVRSVIRECIAAELQVSDEKINDERSMSDYGVDSIVAVKLINALNSALSLVLKTTDLFDYNNVRLLAAHIVNEYRDEMVARVGEKGEESYEEIEEVVVEESPVVADSNRFASPAPAAAPEYGAGFYHRVVIERPCDIDEVRIVNAQLPPLGADEIRVAVRAFSLNFGDLLCVRGLYPTMPPYPFTPGFEASGVIVECGRAVSRKVGESVVVMTGAALGGNATMIVCREEQVFTKPERLSFEEAAALPAVAVTMVAAFDRAKIKKGESILIQTATGGTGLIAVQLAKLYGAEIYATAGSAEKLAYLAERGVQHRINYREEDFEAEIARLTGGRGVDVVINTLSGDAIQKGIRSLAAGGRYIEIAMTALKSAKNIDLSWFGDNQTFYSIDLRKLSTQSPLECKKYQDEMLRLVNEGAIKPTISAVVPFDRFQEAYRNLDRRETIGKVVVTIPEQYRIQVAGHYSQKTGNGGYYDSSAGNGNSKEPIAVVGMSGRFARSASLDEFWRHLAGGDCLIEPISRWNLRAHYAGKTQYCNAGSFLSDIELFDPLFFAISGLEATYMDPQQRIFLEECWNALEDAGYAGDSLNGALCGVYAGCKSGDYQELFGDDAPPQSFWGNAGSAIPARISYFLNLQGPAVAVDTACSSSLVALHIACQALRAREIEYALAGGVFVQSTPQFYLMSEKAGMLSPTGLCHTFDEAADGFVPGEGAGALLLKRLSDAVADGDHIYGVIAGSGINQDGTSNGFTAPSSKSQTRLEESVYSAFDIDPASIQLIETHGTGTKLGDPIEFDALVRTFGRVTDKKGVCALGSVKTNIGHAATAAGVAGVIKLLLSLQHKQMAPSLHFNTCNKLIDLENSPFYVNTTLKEWECAPDLRRRGAVSSFGFSGTNAHLVIEEAPLDERRLEYRPASLIVVSARSEDELKKQVVQLTAYIETHEELPLIDLSYTLLLGRKHFKQRLTAVVADRQELLEHMGKWLAGGITPQIKTAELPDQPEQQIALQRYGNECIARLSTQDGQKYHDDLTAVAGLYLLGYALDYQKIFMSGEYRRVSLPTYPFTRGRYWVENPAEGKAQPAVVRLPEHTPAVTAHEIKNERDDHLVYIPRWELYLPPSPAVKDGSSVVMIVSQSSKSAVAASIYRYYQSTEPDARVIRVVIGDSTDSLGGDEWRCGTDDLHGFAAVLADVSAVDTLFFIGESDTEPHKISMSSIAFVQSRNELQLLRLIKMIKKDKMPSHQLNCYVVTADHYTIDEGVLRAESGSLTGLAYSIAQGDYRVAVRNIDLTLSDFADVESGKKMAALLIDLPASDRGELLKMENGSWYRHAFYRFESEIGNRKAVLRDGGCYVIIGGSGAVGGVITHYLVEEYHATVIWIGRRPENDPDIQQKRIRWAGAQGAVEYVQADATDKKQLRHAVDKIKKKHKQINGVVFSGLVFNLDNSVARTTEEEFLKILEIKTKGSVATCAVFRDEPLDFMCFFSSGQAFSFSGAGNFSAYAAGTTFSDGYIRSLGKSARFPIGCINWGFWDAAIRNKEFENNFKAGALGDKEGFDCFVLGVNMLVERHISQLVCLKINENVKALMNLKEGSVSAYTVSSQPVIAAALDQYTASPYEISQDTVETLERIESHAVAMLFEQLCRMGITARLADSMPRMTFIQTTKILDKYRRLFEEIVAICEEYGYLRDEAGVLSLTESARHHESSKTLTGWEVLRGGLKGTADWDAQLQLLDVCLKQLPEILTGTVKATDVLFPGGSMALVEGTYKSQSLSSYADTTVAGVVGAYVEACLARDTQHTIRMIEIGAGTGSTSSKIFERLAPYSAHLEYCYTDISPAFLENAKQLYGAKAPYLTYALWNIEKGLEEQGIDAGGYDLVVASNVLHATKNIRTTLRHAKAVLRKGGAIIINELMGKILFTTLTFGLLDGWWLYEDGELRIPGAPLLSFDRWQGLFREEGFLRPAAPKGLERSLLQQIMIGESDGLVKNDGDAGQPLVADTGSREDLSVRDAHDSVEEAPPLAFGVEQIRECIVNALSRAVKVPGREIKTGRAFSEYGLDSIMGVAFVKQLNSDLGLDLNSAILFDFATVDQLSAYIAKNYGGRTAALPKKERVQVSAPPLVPAADPAVSVRESIVNALSRAVKVPGSEIKTGRAFSEYGLDSIMGVAFVKQLNSDLGLDLNSAILFDFATVDQLSAYIVKQYGTRITRQAQQVMPAAEDAARLVPEMPEDPFISSLETMFFNGDMSGESILNAVKKSNRAGNHEQGI